MDVNRNFIRAVVAATALLCGAAVAQTPAPKPVPVYTPTSLKVDRGLPRTPQGTPDLQGVMWESPYFPGLTAIPLVTPQELVITEAQSKSAQESLIRMMAPFGILDPEIIPLFRELKGFPIVRGQRRSRALVLPADGKLPLTAEAQAEMQKAMGQFMMTMKADNPEERMVTERCLMQGGAAPYQGPNAFNPMQFIQTADHIVFHTEAGDEVRIIPFTAVHGPTGDAPALGDSIAHWEGDTLVVETTASPANQRLRVTPFGGLIVNPDAKVIERLTRVSLDELIYQFTIVDPKVFTGPWLGEFSMFRSDKRMYPNSCHEGNYALANILSGARYEEMHPPPEWTTTLTEVTAAPNAKWTTAAKNAADVRSWAVLASKDATGEARVGLRIERAQPALGTTGDANLSELNVFAVDCAAQRLRMLTLATFAAHNFTGEKADGRPTGDWQPATSRPAIAAGIRQACG